MNRRQMTAAMALGGAALALGRREVRPPDAMAGGWALLDFINPIQVAVVGVPVVIDAQILQHGTHPSVDFGGSLQFTHEVSGTQERLRFEVISSAHAIARGEHTFTEAGTWRISTEEMGMDVELGQLEVVDPEEGEIVSALRPAVEVAAVCGEVADGIQTEIHHAAFADPLLEVASGTTVTWVNVSPVPHQVVFEDASIEPSNMLMEGDVYSSTFEEPGEYPYYCGPHPFMTGVVRVS